MTEPTSGLPPAFYNPCAIVFDAEVTIALMADRRIREAIERGEFDNVPGSGKPLDLPDRHDPDWWLHSLAKREGLAMLPPSIQLRKDDAALDDLLDQLPDEETVRREVEQFNKQVIRARYDLSPGPPLITMPRDVDATVAAWAERKAARTEAARQRADKEARAREAAKTADHRRRRLFRRRPRRRSPHRPGADRWS